MPAPSYSIVSGGAVALSAAAVKSILGARAHANSGLLMRKLKVGFDGVTSSAVPVLVEICSATFATNPPGTASTAVTPAQKSGRLMTAQFTAAKNWTTEPTVVTVLDETLIPAFMGFAWYDLPLGDEYDCDVSTGFLIRCTAPAIVNVRAVMDLQRC
jgi:hypothetical protein